ncbi:NAD(P)/FAD-dependent oxidoreductase [Streptomyces sp. B3I8]|uniref:NAD(P)/FAD-dependent oxidoreductase n=1 Tax=Streptomyces sp. B3I8 TaxID=3042303 RepID=UPI0027863856|nr:phytoene dehydrogenase-like protein [Streptomyces sp. B3I8]
MLEPVHQADAHIVGTANPPHTRNIPNFSGVSGVPDVPNTADAGGIAGVADITDTVDVVVVGAGVAGLAAARHLTGAGLSVLVLEAAGTVGGRMTSEKVDGFRLDRTGRLLCTSYPELARAPGLETLSLRTFSPGVLLHSEGRHHRAGESFLPAPARRGARRGAAVSAVRGTRGALTAVRALASAPRSARPQPPHRGRPHQTAPGPLGGAAEQARLATVLARLAATPPERLLSRPQRPAAQVLSGYGLPSGVVEGFLRPLLAALLGDPALTSSSRCADLALHAFATGRLCLPEGGADALPELLAAGLPPGSVRTGVRVTAVSTTSVSTREAGEIGCRAVVLATGARSAAALLPGLRVPAHHAATVLHHTTDEPPLTEPVLLLDADRGGPVAHTAVLSQVDPGRAPAGRALVTSVVLGRPEGPAGPGGVAGLDAQVRAHLSRLYRASTSRWELLAVHHDAEAVPGMGVPHDVRRPVRVLSGLYVCGDHRGVSGLQGELLSARRVARAVLADAGASASRPAGRSLETAA